jgi:hypothetical protein
MEKYKELLCEIKDEVILSQISGGNDNYNPGPSMTWGGVMDAVRSCSWPGGFYGDPNPSYTGGGFSTQR